MAVALFGYHWRRSFDACVFSLAKTQNFGSSRRFHPDVVAVAHRLSWRPLHAWQPLYHLEVRQLLSIDDFLRSARAGDLYRAISLTPWCFCLFPDTHHTRIRMGITADEYRIVQPRFGQAALPCVDRQLAETCAWPHRPLLSLPILRPN